MKQTGSSSRPCTPVIERGALPMVEIDGPKHVVRSVNAAFCQLLKRTSAELVGQTFADLMRDGGGSPPRWERIDPTDAGRADANGGEPLAEAAYWLFALWPRNRAGRAAARVVIQVTRSAPPAGNAAAINEALILSAQHQHELRAAAEESNLRLQTQVAEFADASAALHGVIAALREEQSAALLGSRAKDDFLAALSHELRTPLTPVLLTAAALREDRRLPAEIRDEMAMIERNIGLEARLIDDLLDVTKISHGKLELRPEPCDTDRLIRLAVEIVRPDAVAKDIVISCSLGAERSCLVADPTRFQQVIWNLLRNAVKFTPPAGRVSVRTRNQTDESDVEWLRIEVADTGIGIPVERLAEIFLPFDQGGLSGEHRFGGVGLGLAIARAVVERHGGRISARSAGRNRGATLVVELPGPTAAPRETAAPPLPRAGEREDSVPQTNSPRARLLLVDDHPPTLQALRALLCRDGYHVVTAMTAGQAIAAAAAAPLDLVISDLDLPDGRGTDLMTKLRTLHGLRGIALTGYGADRDLLRSREAGFALHLVKPVAIAELRLAIASLLPAKIGQPNSRNGAL